MGRNKLIPAVDSNVTELDHEESPLVLSATDEELQELEQLRAEKKARIKSEEDEKANQVLISSRVTMNLPPAAGKGIQLNGVLYAHGRTYQVDNNTKWALEEQQNRAWAHESSIHQSAQNGRIGNR